MDLTKLLRGLEWHGNVRELENLIENLVVLVQEDILQACHLPQRYHPYEEANRQVIVKGIFPLKEMVQLAEIQLIRNAQEYYSTTQEVAQALGVDASTISRKLSRAEQK